MTEPLTGPVDPAAPRVLTIRGRRVIIDADLARLYGVTTSRLIEQVRRNGLRFPSGFYFRLTKLELSEVIANCDHLRNLRFASVLPLAFTEHGAVMAAGVLKSPRAVEMSVLVVRAFVRMRRLLGAHQRLAAQVAELEKRVGVHDESLRRLVETIRRLMEQPLLPEEETEDRIGFQSPAPDA